MSLIAVFLLMAAAAPWAPARAQTLQKVQEKGTLAVAVFASVKPISFVDPQSGQIVGFVPDLIGLYAKDLGVKIEFLNYDWAGLFPALLTGKVDVVAANVTTTIPRTATLGLAGFWLVTGGHAAVLAGSPYHTLEDLNKKGVVVGTGRGSAYVGLWERDFPNSTVKQLATTADTVQALLTKRIDAIIGDELTLLSGTSGHEKEITILAEIYTPQTYSFVTRPDDFQMQNSLNIFFQMIKLTGEYQALYKKWFGHDWQPQMVGY
jgi:polar amino acid transport system substrate-binding protein